ncbi:hypothetical protein [Acidocella sp.]|uniref:hypothetical protein n=1 Tax=Acidocella sp. TaxID=50710 RepID=UPI0025C2E31C|nr:hypothetical protein [Acidocella sp.]
MMRELAGLAMNDGAALPLYGVRPEGVAALLDGLPPGQAALARLQGFAGQAGAVVLLAGGDGALQGAVLGLGSTPVVHGFGAAAGALPSGTVWRIAAGDFSGEDAALGFLLGAYRFEHLKTRAPKPQAQLAAAQVPARAMVIASAVCAARDLINTPANLLGPAELAQAAMDLGVRFGAHTTHVTARRWLNATPRWRRWGRGLSAGRRRCC